MKKVLVRSLRKKILRKHGYQRSPGLDPRIAKIDKCLGSPTLGDLTGPYKGSSRAQLSAVSC